MNEQHVWPMFDGALRTYAEMMNILNSVSLGHILAPNFHYESQWDCQIAALALAKTAPPESRSDTPKKTWPPLVRNSTTSTSTQTPTR